MLCYDAALAFLRAHGGMLAHCKPELLLPLEEYLKLLAGNGPPLGRKERSAIRKRPPRAPPGGVARRALSAAAYLRLGRVTPRVQGRAARCRAAASGGAAEAVKEISAAGPQGSLLYSQPELLVLRWLEHHCEGVPRVGARRRQPAARATCSTRFDKQLRDGHVLARVVLNHCPYLAQVDAANAADQLGGRAGVRHLDRQSVRAAVLGRPVGSSRRQPRPRARRALGDRPALRRRGGDGRAGALRAV